jgi:hypothetical protein
MKVETQDHLVTLLVVRLALSVIIEMKVVMIIVGPSVGRELNNPEKIDCWDRDEQGSFHPTAHSSIASLLSRKGASMIMPSKFRTPTVDVPADGVTTGGSNEDSLSNILSSRGCGCLENANTTPHGTDYCVHVMLLHQHLSK